MTGRTPAWCHPTALQPLFGGWSGSATPTADKRFADIAHLLLAWRIWHRSEG